MGVDEGDADEANDSNVVPPPIKRLLSKSSLQINKLGSIVPISEALES